MLADLLECAENFDGSRKEGREMHKSFKPVFTVAACLTLATLVAAAPAWCGSRRVQGNGTFVAEGTGDAQVSGTGIVVLSQFTGEFSVSGTEDISGRGYTFVGQQGSWKRYEATNAYVTIETSASRATIKLTGTGSMTGDGTGWVLTLGEGWMIAWKDGSP
jgi:hypothetical protein